MPVVTSHEQAAPDPGRGLPTSIHTVPPETSTFEVARAMVSEGVGDLFVAWDGKPMGVLTDRDLVVRVLARGLDPKALLVWEVMSEPLVQVFAKQDIWTAVGLMARHGIRRLPIVDEAGRLESVLTLDDILLLGLDGRPHLSAIIQGQLRLKNEALGPAETGLSFTDIASIAQSLSATQPVLAVARACAQDVCTVISEAPVGEAAQLMASRGVGDVFVVVDRKPVGILTDRDLVVRVMATGADPEKTLVREVMTQPLVTVTEREGMEKAVELMGTHGIRRLPIVDEAGRLLSVLTLDDILLSGLNGNLALSKILARQLRPRDLPPLVDLSASPISDAPSRPSPRQPPAALAAASEMRQGTSVVESLPPRSKASSTEASPAIVQPTPVSSMKESAPRPELAQPADESANHLSRSGAEVGFGQVRFSRPVTTVARKMVIKPLVHTPPTWFGSVREWLFQSRDWLLLMTWLILLGILAGLVTYYSTESEWFKMPADVYQPKDRERQDYLKQLEKERAQKTQPP